ncbi:MAG: adenosine kinase [Bacteroidetes bacterium]|nr:MAG: adenosine kinase [Bacteroidota bacterium]
MTKIIGLGNALVDIIVFIDEDELLEKLDLPKGSMQLVDIEKSSMIRKACEHLPSSFASGGSAANTIYGLAKLGVETSFIGKIGKDDYGRIFKEDLEKSNIKPVLLTSDTHSGRAVALISPDRERTFATHLGAAIELDADDLHADHFSGHDIFHIEGYIVQNNELLEKAVKLAKENGMDISLDLASYNVVEDNLEFLRYIVKEYVDIVFANEEESKSFTGKEPIEALNELAEFCRIAVVKIGKEGSLVKSGEDVFHIDAIDVELVDTNGAGDIYAAGFLYGLSRGWSLDKCGKTGAILAGKIIEISGARLDETGWEKAMKLIVSI